MLEKIIHSISAGLAILSVASTSAAAQTPKAGSTAYPVGVEEVIAALNSSVTLSQPLFESGRTTARLNIIRNSLANNVANIHAGASAVKPINLLASDVLCAVRGDHAVLAGHRGYLTSVSSGVQRVGTPSEIKGLGDAISTLFQTYAIEVGKKGTSVEKIKATAVKPCQDDLKSFAKVYYGELAAPENVAENIFVEEILGAITAVTKALEAIVNPIVAEVDKAKRKAAIIGYFTGADSKSRREQILLSLREVSDRATKFIAYRRLYAAGQFSEQITVFNTMSVDITKTPECANVSSIGGDKRQSSVFVVCYAKIWKLIEEQVSANLKTAGLYDEFADATFRTKEGKDQLPVDKIGKQMAEIGKDQPKTIKEVWDEILKFVSVANTVQTALSAEHRKKLSDSIDQLVKAF